MTVFGAYAFRSRWVTSTALIGSPLWADSDRANSEVVRALLLGTISLSHTSTLPVSNRSINSLAPTLVKTENRRSNLPVTARSLTTFAGLWENVALSVNDTSSIPHSARTITGYAPTTQTTANRRTNLSVSVVNINESPGSAILTQNKRTLAQRVAASITGATPSFNRTELKRSNLAVQARSISTFAPTVTVVSNNSTQPPRAIVNTQAYSPITLRTENKRTLSQSSARILTGYAPRSLLSERTSIPRSARVISVFPPAFERTTQVNESHESILSFASVGLLSLAPRLFLTGEIDSLRYPRRRTFESLPTKRSYSIRPRRRVYIQQIESMEPIYKTTEEIHTIGLDWIGNLPDGATISSATVAVIEDPTGVNRSATMVLSTNATVQGTRVKGVVLGGEKGRNYLVRFTVVLSTAETLVESVPLTIF